MNKKAKRRLKRKIKKVSLIILNIVIDFAVVGVLALFAASRFGDQLGSTVVAVRSGSMTPTYPVGSVLVERRVNAETDFSKGDVITFIPKGSKDMVTHRIVKTEKQGGQQVFITRGDANQDNDPWKVSKSQIKAEPLFGIPFLGFLLMKLESPRGKIALIMTILTLLILQLFINELVSLRKAAQRAKRRKRKRHKKAGLQSN